MLFFLGLFFCSCGIEDYLFLYPVDKGNIHLELNTRATINLPALNTNEYYYFTNFTLYYRIYISDRSLTNEINTYEDRNGINSALSSDYSVIEPYASSENVTVSNVGSLFSNRRYYALQLESANIDRVLGTGSLGRQITLEFDPFPGTRPSLTIEQQTYPLIRSTGNGSFSPVPTNRYFFNAPELNRSENVIATINADVADKTNVSGPRYTYVSLYIVVTGSDSNYTPIYSRPTFVGIFRLPEPSY
ncbi:MAG: hypothetical protein LBG76_09225 [Treponema sp.]|nr:hypothetical protein [Treponema sp.]